MFICNAWCISPCFLNKDDDDDDDDDDDLAYKRGEDARRKFWIKPLKKTDLGMAEAFFDP